MEKSGNPSDPGAPRRRPAVRDRRRVSADVSDSKESETREAGALDEPSADSTIEEIQQIKSERDAYLDDLRRVQAEFENYRKRILREQTEVVERAAAGLIYQLLGVLDNFDLAVGAAEKGGDFDQMLRGVELVYGELKEALEAQGLEPIEAKGRRFDPNLHEAALEVPGDEQGELVVAEVLRPGYLFKGRVLRPAMVKVTRRAEPSEEGGTHEVGDPGR